MNFASHFHFLPCTLISISSSSQWLWSSFKFNQGISLSCRQSKTCESSVKREHEKEKLLFAREKVFSLSFSTKAWLLTPSKASQLILTASFFRSKKFEEWQVVKLNREKIFFQNNFFTFFFHFACFSEQRAGAIKMWKIKNKPKRERERKEWNSRNKNQKSLNDCVQTGYSTQSTLSKVETFKI